MCIENNSIHLNDRAYKYFFIAANCDKILNEKQKAFMELVFGRKPRDKFCKRIARLTEEAKKNTQWRKQYMDWERQRTYDFEAGKEAGKQKKAEEAAINLLRMDKLSLEEIAQAQGLTLEKVQELKEKLNREPA